MKNRSTQLLACLICCIVRISFSQQKPQVIAVTFAPSASTTEASWLLESYGIHSNVIARKSYTLKFSSQDKREAEMVLGKITHLFQTIPFTGSSFVPHPLIDESGYVLNLFGRVCGDDLLQKEVTSVVGKSVSLTWERQPAYTLLPIDSVNRECFMLLQTETRIAHVAIENQPQSASITAATVIDSPQARNLRTSPARVSLHYRPIERPIISSSLPNHDLVIATVVKRYHLPAASIHLQMSEEVGGTRYFEILIDHSRGLVTKPASFWERLQLIISMYTVSPGKLMVRCALDGQYASGLGTTEPDQGNFTDLEPAYTRAMQESVEEFLQDLSSTLQHNHKT